MIDARPVKTYRLTFWLPLLVVTVFFLLFGIQLFYQSVDRKQTIILNNQQELYETGLQLAHSIEYALANNDLEQANSHITRFSLRRNAELSALINPDEQIQFASFFAWKNQPARGFFDTEQWTLIEQAQSSNAIQQDRFGHSLVLVVPLNLTPSSLFSREDTVPVLWLQTDIHPQLRHASTALLWSALPILLAFVVAIFLLILAIQKMIIKPLALLQGLAEQLRQKQPVNTCPLTGHTQLSQVAEALVRTGQELNQHIASLTEREHRLDITLQSIGDAVIVTDADGLISRMNPVACQLTAWPVDDALGKPLAEIFDIYQAGSDEKMPCPVDKVLSTGEMVELTNNTVLKARDGQLYHISDSAAPIQNVHTPGESILGVILVFQNVTHQYALRQELRETVNFLQNLLRLSPCVTYVLDVEELRPTQFQLSYVTESVEAMSGYSVEQWLTDPHYWAERIHPEDLNKVYKTLNEALESATPIRHEFRIRHQDGHYLTVLDYLNASPPRADEARKIVGVIINVTEQRQAEQKINFLAHHDVLTQLPNRALLADRIRQALISAERHNQKLCLLYMDLDRFKFINDSLGHDVGDKLLIAVAHRLTEQIREQDTVCRTGGDEFVILLPDTDADGAAHVAQKVVQAMALPFNVDSNQLFVTLSIGISVFPDNGIDADSLNKHADTAMYRAKHAGRNQYQFFTEEMHSQIVYKLELEHALRFALERDELFLLYQPQILTETEKIIGAEALLRWQHPQLGLISPLEFIPIAEETGLINPIGQWILHTAIKQCKAWVDMGYKDIVIAINLSAVQFNNPLLIDLIVDILKTHQLPAKHLALEITESVAMVNMQLTIKQLRAMADHGMRLALDDFGTGYSSLNYLKQFPIHTLKIDQGFVFDMLVDDDDAAIVEAVITLARALGLKTLAEGVESQDHVTTLKQKGCDGMQGFFFSKPVAANDFIDLLKSQSVT